jgi:cob(I)alamin adenosyltransferase
LESGIDKMWAELPPLKNFILPGGSPLAASLHVCRSVNRRAERQLLLLHEVEPVRVELLQFLNRLSDWLFTAARKANANAGVEDVLWTKEKL